MKEKDDEEIQREIIVEILSILKQIQQNLKEIKLILEEIKSELKIKSENE
jgi:hypothetical protein